MNSIYILHLGLAIAIVGVVVELLMDYRRHTEIDTNVPAWRGYVVRAVTFALIWLTTGLPAWGALMYFGLHLLTFDPIMGWLITDNWLHLGETKWWDRSLRWLQSKLPFPLIYLRLFIGIVLVSLYYFPNGYLRTWPF